MVNTAFVFPGQGSQSVGMLSDFIPKFPEIRDFFAEASEAVGYDVWHLTQHGPAEQLNQTEYTQVAVLTADVALYRLLMKDGVFNPQLMAGHSLGEYAALVCADAVSLSDAARLVACRGRLMQQAVPLGKGAMAAIIGLTDAEVDTLCLQACNEQEQVSAANYNAIGQVVVAGHTPAVQRVIALAEEAGASLARLIPVSVPCHCPLLNHAAELFAAHLAETSFSRPSIDVISNVDLSIYYSADHIRQKLQEQLYSPVRWVEIIQLFKSKDIVQTVECGPGKVLGGLIKRIDRSIKTLSAYDAAHINEHVLSTRSE